MIAEKGITIKIYDSTKIDQKNIDEIITLINQNIWFNYLYKMLNRDVGWIDFEKEIGFVLKCFSAYSSLLSARMAPTPHQNPPKPSREKEKVLQSCHVKRADLKTVHSVTQTGSVNFQRYFLPM